MSLWFELLEIAKSITFSEADDSLIWNLNSNGVYSVKSLYNVVNFRGVLPNNTPAVWNIKIPARIHIFLWLLVNNKILTRDHLVKRQNVSDFSCAFCSCHESCHHLFFGCDVMIEFWRNLSRITGYSRVVNMLSLSDCWLRGGN